MSRRTSIRHPGESTPVATRPSGAGPLCPGQRYPGPAWQLRLRWLRLVEARKHRRHSGARQFCGGPKGASPEGARTTGVKTTGPAKQDAPRSGVLRSDGAWTAPWDRPHKVPGPGGNRAQRGGPSARQGTATPRPTTGHHQFRAKFENPSARPNPSADQTPQRTSPPSPGSPQAATAAPAPTCPSPGSPDNRARTACRSSAG